MINGIHCDVSYDEMLVLLSAKMEKHMEKVQYYTDTASSLEANGMTVTGHSRDALGDIRTKVREHQRKHDYVKFVRDHVVPGETYRLSESDLWTLGIVDRGY